MASTLLLLYPGEDGDLLIPLTVRHAELRAHAGEVSLPGGAVTSAQLHAVAEDPDHAVADAVAELGDPDASAEALRHVLVGGAPSVEGFAAEVAEAEGGEPIPAHQATKLIGEILAELD